MPQKSILECFRVAFGENCGSNLTKCLNFGQKIKRILVALCAFEVYVLFFRSGGAVDTAPTQLVLAYHKENDSQE